jgi:formylglycine-generating enzyme required for sulfatase activity
METATAVKVLGPASPAAQSAPAQNAASAPVASGTPAPSGKTYKNSIGMEFVLIPAGSFDKKFTVKNEFGEEQAKTRFIISKPFYLGKYEVTQEQWVAVMGGNPSHFKGRTNPVEQVSWNDAQEFIRRLNAREGHGRYRLPTEMEWELAARGGTDTD